MVNLTCIFNYTIHHLPYVLGLSVVNVLMRKQSETQMHLLNQNINQNWWVVVSDVFSQHLGEIMPAPVRPIVPVFGVIAAPF